jgi:hypothetical protein
MQMNLSDAEAKSLLRVLKDYPDLGSLRQRIEMNYPAKLAVPLPASGFQLGAASLQRLAGVHPDLVKVVKRAIEITPIDFTVLEGLRSRERQRQLVAKGASKTMNSYHLTGHAVDIAPLVNGKVSWDWQYYHPLAGAMKTAARELGVKVEWGGDWQRFKDGPHWQIPRA